jgi:hypothetical protein
MESLGDGGLLEEPGVDWWEEEIPGRNPRPSDGFPPVSCGSTCLLVCRNLRLLAAWASLRLFLASGESLASYLWLYSFLFSGRIRGILSNVVSLLI